ncbi:uncharacterized protein VTP21DRAFT_10576 [Calcarisporiella thermophila]|uniref:uncharacterized protein n=1 Tax=Calcarisporiella thermophila TaxID=911321 RepID=UPI0037435B22
MEPQQNSDAARAEKVLAARKKLKKFQKKKDEPRSRSPSLASVSSVSTVDPRTTVADKPNSPRSSLEKSPQLLMLPSFTNGKSPSTTTEFNEDEKNSSHANQYPHETEAVNALAIEEIDARDKSVQSNTEEEAPLDIKARLKLLEENLKAREATIGQLRAKKLTLERRLKDGEELSNKLEAELLSLRDQLKLSQEREASLHTLENQRNKLVAQVKEQEETINQSRAENRAMAENVQCMKTLVESKEEEVNSLRDQLHKTQQDLANQESALSSLQQTLSICESKLSEATSENEHLHSLRTATDALREENVALSVRIQETMAALAKKENLVAELLSERDSLQSNLDIAEVSVAKLSMRVTEAENRADVMESERDEVLREMEELKLKMEEVRTEGIEAIKRLEGEVSILTEQLESNKTGDVVSAEEQGILLPIMPKEAHSNPPGILLPIVHSEKMIPDPRSDGKNLNPAQSDRSSQVELSQDADALQAPTEALQDEIRALKWQNRELSRQLSEMRAYEAVELNGTGKRALGTGGLISGVSSRYSSYTGKSRYSMPAIPYSQSSHHRMFSMQPSTSATSPQYSQQHFRRASSASTGHSSSAATTLTLPPTPSHVSQMKKKTPDDSLLRNPISALYFLEEVPKCSSCFGEVIEI